MKQLIFLAALFSALFCFSQTNEIDSLTIQLAYQKQDSTKVETSLHLIKALYHSKDYKKALSFIDQTNQLSKNLNFKKGIADVNYYKALIYANKNDYFNAIDSFNKSKKIYLLLNDTLGVAKVNNSIGLIEIKRGNYSIGLESSLSAIHVFESKNLRKDLSSAYNNLAEAYYNTHQVEKALEFNYKALTIREQLEDSSAIKTSTKNIAMLYSLRKEHRKAIEYYEKVLKLINPKKDQVLRGEILPRIGEEYLRFNDYNKAAQYLVEGLKYNRENKNNQGILRSLNSIAYLNLKQNNLKTAAIQLNEAHNIAVESENKPELLKNYGLQKVLDSTNGRFQNAFFWQSKFYDLKTELDKENTPKVVIDSNSIKKELTTETVLEEDSLELQAKNLNHKSEIKTLEATTYILCTALLILFIIVLLVLLKRKNRIKYTKELEEKNKQIQIQNDAILEQTHHLEDINKVKDRLFSIVSHDLKDSISSVKALLDLLKEDSISKEEFYELIPELSENADNASALLFNLLNWSKSQMQNLEPHPELFNIQDVFNDKISLVEQKIEQKRIVLINESQRGFIYADRSMVEIIIQNLLTNAVKFSRVGDVITISNKDYNGKSLICIEDTGVGISKENLKKLFNNGNFTTTGTKNEKGTGLGLTICKELAELNGGKIWVESTQNVGSKFYVELPKINQEY